MLLVRLEMRKQGGVILAAFSFHEEGLHHEESSFSWEVHRDRTGKIKVHDGTFPQY